MTAALAKIHLAAIAGPSAAEVPPPHPWCTDGRGADTPRGFSTRRAYRSAEEPSLGPIPIACKVARRLSLGPDSCNDEAPEAGRRAIIGAGWPQRPAQEVWEHMPTYEYECDSCAYRFEKFQSITARPVRVCPKCGGEVTRLISAGSGVIFKGSGFYETDYRSAEYKKRVREESGVGAGEKSSGGKSDEGKSGAKESS